LVLKSALCEELDSRPLREELRSQPSAQRKLALWHQLKV
jgi:hypothetical protein